MIEMRQLIARDVIGEAILQKPLGLLTRHSLDGDGRRRTARHFRDE